MIDFDQYAATHVPPQRDEASAPFFAAAAQNRLVLPRCEVCSVWLPPMSVACPRCQSDALIWTTASGRGKVFSWTVIHNAPPAFRSEIPYLIVEVELDEGPHLETRLLGVTPSAVRLDLPVEAGFCHPREGDSYPIFMASPTLE
jgi:uncharacterized OB-fold protein